MFKFAKGVGLLVAGCLGPIALVVVGVYACTGKQPEPEPESTIARQQREAHEAWVKRQQAPTLAAVQPAATAAPRPAATAQQRADDSLAIGAPTVRWTSIWTEAMAKATNTSDRTITCLVQGVWEEGDTVLASDDALVAKLPPGRSEVVKLHSAVEQRIPKGAKLTLSARNCRFVSE